MDSGQGIKLFTIFDCYYLKTITMKSKIECTWKKDMAFEAEVDGFKLMLDAEPEVGGQDQGPRPKPLTLVSLAGCTGMDVISILGKMRVVPDYFNVSVEGELTEEHPRIYHKILLVYEFRGEGLDMEKLRKAIDLSQDRYCGVSALLKKSAEITYEIKILD
jgi:putative redox protein